MRLILACGCLLTVSLVGACASTKPRVYDPAALRGGNTFAVSLAYEVGEEETRVSNSGTEQRIIRQGNSSRDLAFRDAIAFALRDEGFRISSDAAAAALQMELHPTVRVADCGLTCGVYDAVAVVLRRTSAPEEPVARIEVSNGVRRHAKNDRDFAEYTAEAIIKLLRGMHEP